MRTYRRYMTAACLSLCVALVLGCSVDTKGLPPLDGGGDSAEPAENTSERCQDGQDNDGDGKTDCDDDQCAIFVVCGGDAGPGGDGAVDVQGVDSAHDLGLDLPAPDVTAVDVQVPDVGDPDVATTDLTGPDTQGAPDIGADTTPLVDTTPAADLASLDQSLCGNGTCDVGESCDGRQNTVSCLADCPGVTTGPGSQQYCYVNGVCQGAGCP